MEYNLVLYFSAPSLMQLGDGIGKMVLTRHPVFSAAAHQSRQTVQSNLYASSSPNNQHSNPFFSSDTIIAIKTTSNSSETFSHHSAKLYFPFFPEAPFCGRRGAEALGDK